MAWMPSCLSEVLAGQGQGTSLQQRQEGGALSLLPSIRASCHYTAQLLHMLEVVCYRETRSRFSFSVFRKITTFWFMASNCHIAFWKKMYKVRDPSK